MSFTRRMPIINPTLMDWTTHSNTTSFSITLIAPGPKQFSLNAKHTNLRYSQYQTMKPPNQWDLLIFIEKKTGNYNALWCCRGNIKALKKRDFHTSFSRIRWHSTSLKAAASPTLPITATHTTAENKLSLDFIYDSLFRGLLSMKKSASYLRLYIYRKSRTFIHSTTVVLVELEIWKALTVPAATTGYFSRSSSQNSSFSP